jgi:hypothetical protein
LSFWVFRPKFFVFLGLGLGLNFGFFGFLGLGLGLGGKPKYQTQNHKIFGCQCLLYLIFIIRALFLRIIKSKFLREILQLVFRFFTGYMFKIVSERFLSVNHLFSKAKRFKTDKKHFFKRF